MCIWVSFLKGVRINHTAASLPARVIPEENSTGEAGRGEATGEVQSTPAGGDIVACVWFRTASCGVPPELGRDG